MNWDRITGNWKQMRGKLEEQWGKLTDDEFDIIEGNRGHLVGKIQERYGIARDEAERQVTEWDRASACSKARALQEQPRMSEARRSRISLSRASREGRIGSGTFLASLRAT